MTQRGQDQRANAGIAATARLAEQKRKKGWMETFFGPSWGPQAPAHTMSDGSQMAGPPMDEEDLDENGQPILSFEEMQQLMQGGR
jgi:hypothetical protein